MKKIKNSHNRNRSGIIKAKPDLLAISNFGFYDKMTILWASEDTKSIEVHLDSPNGRLICRGGPMGSSFFRMKSYSTDESNNVSMFNKQVFFLQDVSNGLPLTAHNTLDTVTIYAFNTKFNTPCPGCIPSGIKDLHHLVKGSLRKILVAGWFSVKCEAATAGDLLALNIICEWLKKAGYSYDVALSGEFAGGVDLDKIDIEEYTDFIFVCGPFGNQKDRNTFKKYYGECRLIGINLSVLYPLDLSNPFDILFERDSSVTSRPDITFLSRKPLVPVVGVILVEPQTEYPERSMHNVIHQAIRRVLSKREVAVVEIDTRLPINIAGLRTTAEVESLIARMDLVITTRLHGLVLAIKNGVPAIAIDSHAGGSKVRSQADTIGWPIAFNPDSLTEQAMLEAFDYCLTENARQKARECSCRAIKMLDKLCDEFIASLAK